MAINFDKRFFNLNFARYDKKAKTLRLEFAGFDNFEPEIPTLEKTVTAQIIDHIGQKIAIEYDYIHTEFTNGGVEVLGGGMSALEQLRRHAETVAASISTKKVDKALAVRNVEYHLGRPIKIRPIKIQYLKISPEEQVTAGTMHFLTRREYIKKTSDAVASPPLQNGETGVAKPYWTFVLNDGESTVNCVFFPTVNTLSKFEMLKDKTAICVIGVHASRNDRTNFRVTGIAFCDMV